MRLIPGLWALLLLASTKHGTAYPIWGSWSSMKNPHKFFTGNEFSEFRSVITSSGTSTIAPGASTLLAGYLDTINVFFAHSIQPLTYIEQELVKKFVEVNGGILITAHIDEHCASYVQPFGLDCGLSTDTGTVCESQHSLVENVSSLDTDYVLEYQQVLFYANGNGTTLCTNNPGDVSVSVHQFGNGFLMFVNYGYFQNDYISVDNSNAAFAENVVNWIESLPEPTQCPTNLPTNTQTEPLTESPPTEATPTETPPTEAATESTTENSTKQPEYQTPQPTTVTNVQNNETTPHPTAAPLISQEESEDERETENYPNEETGVEETGVEDGFALVQDCDFHSECSYGFCDMENLCNPDCELCNARLSYNFECPQFNKECQRVTGSAIGDTVFLIVAGVFVFLLILLFIVGKCKSRKAQNIVIFLAGLAIFDFVTDCFFVYEMFLFHSNVLQISSLLFVVLPFLLNATLSIKVLMMESHSMQVREWFDRNVTAATLVFFLSWTKLDVFQLLFSEVFRLDLFKLPYSKHAKATIIWYGMVGDCLEDIPQLILQLVVLSTSTTGASTIVIASLVSTIASIIFSILRRVLTRLIHADEFRSNTERRDVGSVPMENLNLVRT